MITKEQFGLWKHEPVTKWFMEVLTAKRDEMIKIVMDQWRAGVINPEPRDVIRGQVIQLDEILTVGFDELEAFYKENYGTKPEGN